MKETLQLWGDPQETAHFSLGIVDHLGKTQRVFHRCFGPEVLTPELVGRDSH